MARIIDFARQQLGVKLYEGQASVLADYYNSRKPNWLLLAGRRSGKSLLSDIIAAYEAVIPDYSGILRPFEDRYIIVVSTRLDNAQLHIKNIAGLLRHTREIGGMIKEIKQDRIEMTNGVTILSLPASARAGRGYTASTVILDELAHFVDSQGNASADQVFDAFSPTVATFGDLGKIVVTTTPAARVGIVYDLYDRSQQGDLEDFFISHKATRELNPKVSQRTIDRAMKRDELSATVEYMAEFSDPVASFFDSQTIDQAVNRKRAADKGDPAQRYAMAIDPAVMGDRYGYAIMHREGEQIILDYANVLYPPVNPAHAEELLLDLVRRFKPYTIRCDTAATVQRLKDQIPAMNYTPFTRPLKLKIYGSLKEAMNLGRLELYDHHDLIDELKALQIKNGVDISAPKSGRVKHDDLADCLALCTDELMVNLGVVSWVDDPFDDVDPEMRHAIWDDARGAWIKKDAPANRHSPGATSWRDCRRRNRGCLQCQEELEREGYFAQEEAIRAAGPTVTEEEDRQWRYELHHPELRQPLSQEEVTANIVTDKIVRKILKGV